MRHGTGFCYAKSYLLAALLRANRIPAGLCYQRLTIENGTPPFSLHGLNAVFIEPYGWYRIDPRGNKSGIEADFSPPVEKLAFPILSKGEADLPEIWDEPLERVISTLKNNKTYMEVAENLPDIEIIGNFPYRINGVYNLAYSTFSPTPILSLGTERNDTLCKL